MAVKIIPYKNGSESAKALSEALNIKQLKLVGSRFRGKHGDVVINWGLSRDDHPVFQGNARILNPPNAIIQATDKRNSFRAFRNSGVACPEFTMDRHQAIDMVQQGKTLVVRAKTNGHSGEGITIFTPDMLQEVEVPVAPLYTVYIKKTEEYRLHVMDGEVFFVQRKARRHDVADDAVNWQVRNHGNGFIYAHQNVEVPQEAKDLAVEAVNSLNLDFGAVDLIKTKLGNWYCLEVNTACGLEGTTLDKYKENFEKFVANAA